MGIVSLGFLQPLLELAHKTSQEILEIYFQSRQFTVRSKADASPLTQADLIAHETLVVGLKQMTPNLPVLSEEQPDFPFLERQKWPRYWLIDPLDGTKEFIRHTSDFTINIALIENYVPIFGLIYVPVLDEAYYAYRGKGAFKQKIGAKPQPIHTQKYLETMRVIVGHGCKVEKLQGILAYFPSFEILTVGSSMKFCYIAEGKADMYPRVGITYEWDTAAGQILVEEAGGAVVDFALHPLQYNVKDSLLNPHFLAVGDKRLLKKYRLEK